jgi:hypothetical protein
MARLFFLQKEDRSHGPMGIGIYLYSVPIAIFYTLILFIRSAKTVTELKKR